MPMDTEEDQIFTTERTVHAARLRVIDFEKAHLLVEHTDTASASNDAVRASTTTLSRRQQA